MSRGNCWTGYPYVNSLVTEESVMIVIRNP
jgi:hypothetical protein